MKQTLIIIKLNFEPFHYKISFYHFIQINALVIKHPIRARFHGAICH